MHVCVCMCIDQQLASDPVHLFIHLLFEIESLIGLEFINYARQAGQQNPGIHLFLRPQSWDYKHVSPYPTFFKCALEAELWFCA